jgi:hypothetical protein
VIRRSSMNPSVEQQQREPDNSLRFTLRRALLLVFFVAGWLGLLRVEWTRGSNASPLLGPLFFNWYNPEDFTGFVLASLLTPCLFAFLLKPQWTTFGISLLGFLLWWFLGVIGQGIGC